MRTGRLRHRIELQKPTGGHDTYGGEPGYHTPVATVWGAIEPLRGREFEQMERAGAEETTRIVIRHYDGVKPHWRVVWNDHTYDIVNVIRVDERSREINLMCREIVS